MSQKPLYYSGVQATFFKSFFQVIFYFPSIFSKLHVVCLYFFYFLKALSMKSVLHTKFIHVRLILASLQRSKVKELAKDSSRVRNFQIFQFYFSLRFFYSSTSLRCRDVKINLTCMNLVCKTLFRLRAF